MVDIVALTAQNAARWKVARVDPGKASAFNAVAARLCNLQLRTSYNAVSKITGVPWWVIAVIHERECSQSWECNIAQGDPWTRRSTHDPVGRGPFSSWQNAAVDALTACPPHAAAWKDWSPGGTLTLLEQYNGLGYAMRDVPSPYIWSGTDQYKSGKFTRDHYYDPDVIDAQLGCAGLLLAMQPIGKFTLDVIPAPVPAAVPEPTVAALPLQPESLLQKIEDIL